jgi:hypothetical protein
MEKSLSRQRKRGIEQRILCCHFHLRGWRSEQNTELHRSHKARSCTMVGLSIEKRPDWPSYLSRGNARSLAVPALSDCVPGPSGVRLGRRLQGIEIRGEKDFGGYIALHTLWDKEDGAGDRITKTTPWPFTAQILLAAADEYRLLPVPHTQEIRQ